MFTLRLAFVIHVAILAVLSRRSRGHGSAAGNFVNLTDSLPNSEKPLYSRNTIRWSGEGEVRTYINGVFKGRSTKYKKVKRIFSTLPPGTVLSFDIESGNSFFGFVATIEGEDVATGFSGWKIIREEEYRNGPTEWKFPGFSACDWEEPNILTDGANRPFRPSSIPRIFDAKYVWLGPPGRVLLRYKVGGEGCPSETPLVTPAVSPIATPLEDPSETPLVTPAVSPIATPFEDPSETPLETPAVSPIATPFEDPSETPLEAPAVSPIATPLEDPSETPLEDPSETPRASETPTESPSPSPTPTPAQSNPPTPVGTAAKVYFLAHKEATLFHNGKFVASTKFCTQRKHVILPVVKHGDVISFSVTNKPRPFRPIPGFRAVIVSQKFITTTDQDSWKATQAFTSSSEWMGTTYDDSSWYAPVAVESSHCSDNAQFPFPISATWAKDAAKVGTVFYRFRVNLSCL